ncbi:MAG: hypothetical protein HYS43_00700 [Candidatus Liptonbacteria bacterium]|nr:hypothetical protein [Candidatus Liptonbacteria bacterium]
MPHIRAILAQDDHEVRALLETHKATIRRAVAGTFGYAPSDVAFIPNLLTPDELRLSDNLSRLTLVVDLGKWSTLDDSFADSFLQALLEVCSGMKNINVGVWIRGMESNGFAEREPEPDRAA